MTSTPTRSDRRPLPDSVLRAPETWVHHVARLDDRGDGAVSTIVRDRPITLKERAERLVELIDPSSIVPILVTADRTLTARLPYLASPLSYLNAVGRSWSLDAETGVLGWAEFGEAGSRPGQIDFWFLNVQAGSSALVTIAVEAGSIVGKTGHVEVRSSDGAPRTFDVGGFADQTLDLLVTPADAFGCLVSLEIKGGMSYLGFRSITYKNL